MFCSVKHVGVSPAWVTTLNLLHGQFLQYFVFQNCFWKIYLKEIILARKLYNIFHLIIIKKRIFFADIHASMLDVYCAVRCLNAIISISDLYVKCRMKMLKVTVLHEELQADYLCLFLPHREQWCGKSSSVTADRSYFIPRSDIMGDNIICIYLFSESQFDNIQRSSDWFSLTKLSLMLLFKPLKLNNTDLIIKLCGFCGINLKPRSLAKPFRCFAVSWWLIWGKQILLFLTVKL